MRVCSLCHSEEAKLPKLPGKRIAEGNDPHGWLRICHQRRAQHALGKRVEGFPASVEGHTSCSRRLRKPMGKRLYAPKPEMTSNQTRKSYGDGETMIPNVPNATNPASGREY